MSQVNSDFAIFGGNNLANLVTGLTVLGIDTYKPAKRKLTIAQIAATSKNKVSNAFYTARAVSVRVGISRTKRDDVEQSIDTLLSYLQGLEQELWVPQSGGTRKYICTYQDTNVLKGGGAYWEAELIFTCSDVYGYDTAYTTAVFVNAVTASTRNDQYNFIGSATQQAPIFTVYFTALTGGTGGTVTIGNAASGQSIAVTRTWAAGDRLEIDSNNETVKINGTEVAFSGAFPRFAAGVGNVTYADTLTTRSFNYNVIYYKRYA